MRPARPVGASNACAAYVPSGSASKDACPFASVTATSPFESVTCASATGPPESGSRTVTPSDPTDVEITTSGSVRTWKSAVISPRALPCRATWLRSRATTVTAPAKTCETSYAPCASAEKNPVPAGRRRFG